MPQAASFDASGRKLQTDAGKLAPRNGMGRKPQSRIARSPALEHNEGDECAIGN